MGLLAILVGIALIFLSSFILLLFFISWKHRSYFKKRGAPYSGAGYGRLFRFLRGKASIVDIEMDLYRLSLKYNSPVVGVTDSIIRPAYYVTDMELSRNIYVKDFDHFMNRRQFGTTKSSVVFQKMLVGMENEEWKGLRSKLSPTFTTGKIRRMFTIFETSSTRMCDYLENLVGSAGNDFDICRVYSKYAMDVIARCACGVDSKSFDCEPDKCSWFEEMGQKLQLQFKPSVFIKFIFVLMAPKLADMLGIEAFDSVPINYFSKVIKEVMKRRRETGERHDDFLQLMLDTQEGLLKNEENSKESLEVLTGTDSAESKDVFQGVTRSEKFNFDDDTIVGNCVLFLLAGFDTLQSLLIFSAYQLAIDQDVQTKLLREVTDSMQTNGGKLTYDSVTEMTYLDLFINETLRHFPPALRTERVCTKEYAVPGTDIVIEKGTLMLLPVITVHHDPKHYDDPEKFIPERFLPENKSKRHPYAFTPFGHGPRNCIGMRFAITEVKVLVATLVKRFKLEPSSKTDIPAKYASYSSLKPVNGMWLNICPRS